MVIFDLTKKYNTMKILLEKTESEELFYNSLCNGLGYIGGYGLELTFDDDDYEKAKKTLKRLTPDTTICYEDVLMQVLREGGELTLIDHECEGEYTSKIKMEDVHERVVLTPIRHLMDAINHEDDADTADCIIQSVFFKDVIFG
jgi:DUF971 family protein